MPSRRTLLHTFALAAGGAVAGCLDDTGPSGSGTHQATAASSATASPTERRGSPTPSVTERRRCSEPRRPQVPSADDGDEVEPRRYPEKPERLTTGAVEPYVREFERAYKVNAAIERYDLSRFDFVSWSVDAVRAVEDGVRAEAGGHVAPFTGGPTSTYHYDEAYVASYLVTERAVWRAEASGGDPPEPTSGRVVVCSP